ncbi:curli-like amyloid fiber formation chaperone CsgH [Methylorubrum populi]|uniref:curli-like amyloid fiber formation chaperone CsgH n=1 Tax=Methylorubrum populi TaxID=223967 RepID=UPI0030B91162
MQPLASARGCTFLHFRLTRGGDGLTQQGGTMPADLPPPPLACSLSEHHAGMQVEILAEIRANSVQQGLYRLRVTKDGPSGRTQVSQQAAFSLEPGAVARMHGVSLSMEHQARYRAVLIVEAGDQATYRCERSGPEAADPL